MRQCDKLDGLVDGIINNYMACRETFDVKQGKPNRHPWAAKRCPGNMDPNPADTSADACLTDGQISTLEFVYSRYSFSQPLANGVKTFGMWLPNTDPSGSGLIANTRFRGQEGAAENAPQYSWIGVLGVTGFLMQISRAMLWITQKEASTVVGARLCQRFSIHRIRTSRLLSAAAAK
jgi:feruloyl esterase